MKKIYSTICMGVIASVLLFPVTAHSQDLTEAQKQERCQNNKNRIAELETQLKIINADLSQAMEPQEIEDARTQMVFVRSMKNLKNHSVENLNKFLRIIAQYNFSYSRCYIKIDGQTYENNEECTTELENIIAKKINKAVSLDRPALLAKKIEIEKQISNHRTNLVALGCDKKSKSCPPNVVGKYEIQLDGYPAGILSIDSQSGTQVSGRYGKDEGSLGNTIAGKFSGDKSCILKGTFINTQYKSTGEFTFTFQSDGTGFSGSWGHTDKSHSGTWSGTRK